MVRDLKYAINDDQLRILLYVVEDLQKNVSHYGTGFALLKAILRRKYSTGEVHELMRKTGELSIVAYNDSVRLMARKVKLKRVKRKRDTVNFFFFLFFFVGLLLLSRALSS